MFRAKKPAMPERGSLLFSSKKHRLVGSVLAATCVSVLFTFTGSCIFPSGTDFSRYDGVNLIPGKQFTVPVTSPDLGWTPDEAPLTTYAGAENMWYEPVSTAALVNESGDTWAGYTDETTLRFGLPLLPDGSVAPIFRLETKNLFINGDFEGVLYSYDFAAAPLSTPDAHRLPVNPSTLVDPLDPTKALGSPYVMQDHWMQLNFDDSFQSVAIPFTGNVAGHTPTTSRSYSLSFKYIIDFEPNKYIALDDVGTGPTAGGVSPDAVPIAIENRPINVEHRFPFEVFSGDNINESSILTSTANILQNIIFNPQPSAPDHLNNGAVTIGGLKGSLDDFQLVRSAYPHGIRVNIPWDDSSRPTLQRGGIYVVKLWVRADKTNNYSGSTSAVPNRFAADFLSVSLHQYTSSNGLTGSVGAVFTNSQGMGLRAAQEGWTNYSDFDSWTLISASFSDKLLLNSGTQSGNALQLVISATNMGNSSLRSPGSILIANPQLYWSPN